MNLPMVLSFVVFSFLCGTLTVITGHNVQFAYFTVIFLSIGTGLLSSLNIDSGYSQWISYQFPFGAGVGFGLQTAFTPPQTALSIKDVPIGTSIVMFFEHLTAAIMVSVAQNVFTNQLKTNLWTYIPSIDPGIIQDVGAMQIKSHTIRFSSRIIRR